MECLPLCVERAGRGGQSRPTGGLCETPLVPRTTPEQFGGGAPRAILLVDARQASGLEVEVDAAGRRRRAHLVEQRFVLRARVEIHADEDLNRGGRVPAPLDTMQITYVKNLKYNCTLKNTQDTLMISYVH